MVEVRSQPRSRGPVATLSESGPARIARWVAFLWLLQRRKRGESLGPISWVVLAVAAVGLFATLQPVLGAQFGMIDDHKAIANMPPTERLPLTDVPRVTAEETAEPVGRFRPVYWLGQAIEMATAGHSATWWYVDRLSLAGVVLVALFVVASRIVGPLPAAAVALLPFSGPQVETWLRLGPNEAYAMPLAAVGLAIVARRAMDGRTRPLDAAPGYLLFALAALAKENFITLLPAAVAVSVATVGLRRLRRADWIVISLSMAVTMANLYAIRSKVARYGTIYPQETSPRLVLRQVRVILETQQTFAWIWVAVLVVLALAIMSDRLELLRAIAIGATTGVLLVIPQAFLMAGIALEGRYFYPVILLACVAWTLAFWNADRIRHGRSAVTLLLLAGLAVPLYHGHEFARDAAQQSKARTVAFQQQLRDVAMAAQMAETRTVVLQPSQPALDFEPVNSLSIYLTKQYGLRVMAVPAPSSDSEFSAMLNEMMERWSRKGGDHFSPYVAGSHCVSVLLGSTEPSCDAAVRFR